MARGATAKGAGLTGFSELRHRLLFVLGALVVYRIGTFIPVPGIDPVALARFFEQQQGTILSVFNMFSGGALERLSILALGIMPYISASIIMQMMAVARAVRRRFPRAYLHGVFRDLGPDADGQPLL
jgi:preprotein translocase subunit SecY